MLGAPGALVDFHTDENAAMSAAAASASASQRVDREAAGAAEGRVAVVEDHLLHCESLHKAISVVPRAPRYA